MTTPTESGSTDPVPEVPEWWIFHGTGQPRPHLDLLTQLPPPPQWRTFGGRPDRCEPPHDETSGRYLGPARTRGFAIPLGPERKDLLDKVNAAIHLRRPLLLVGPPGVGKSSLAHQISRELRLGRVLRWPVTSRSTVRDGLYSYDPLTQIHDLNLENARARITGAEGSPGAGARGGSQGRPGTEEQEGAEGRPGTSARSIGRYLALGPLGTAFLPARLPRVLLVDDFDLGDFDLSGDLLDLFESGGFHVPELARLAGVAERIAVATDDPGRSVSVERGRVLCSAFPIVVLTCNNERDLPPAFMRRCIPVRMGLPREEELLAAVAGHFDGNLPTGTRDLVTKFLDAGVHGDQLALDQLLNAVHLVGQLDHGAGPTSEQVDHLAELLWHRLTEPPG